jgi:hypothetical protein
MRKILLLLLSPAVLHQSEKPVCEEFQVEQSLENFLQSSTKSLATGSMVERHFLLD